MKEYGELRLGTPRLQRSPVTGRFLKGSTPFNKGKTWDELKYSKRQRQRMMRGWANLDKFRGKTRRENAGRNRRAVIGINNEGVWARYEAINDAYRKTGCLAPNIRRCANSNHRGGYHKDCGHHDSAYLGIRWYWEEDDHLWSTRIDKPLLRRGVV